MTHSRVQVRNIQIFVTTLRTRMPFRYGIATMTVLPHVFVQIDATIDGKTETGIAGDNLPPKWFTKDPGTSYADDLTDLQEVILQARKFTEESVPGTVFSIWRQVHAALEHWGRAAGIAPLVTSFAASLMERALIDAQCRRAALPFATLLRSGAFGIRLGEIHRELVDSDVARLLPAPRRSIIVRHTVGIGDPLTEGDIAAEEQIDDGLPHSLQACISHYGLTYLKIKLRGDLDADIDQLRRIQEITKTHIGSDLRFTLDGNENFTDVDELQTFWQKLREQTDLKEFLKHMLFLEQPLHRTEALSETTAGQLGRWSDRPKMIIDESDDALASARMALGAGYAGTSHKNCKGVFKGIANACLIETRRQHGHTAIQSAEDLANVGPVALLQDLAVAANLGISHVERNGHHYFKGLTMFPADIQASTRADHRDLYKEHPDGYPTLNITKGILSLEASSTPRSGPPSRPSSSGLTASTPWNHGAHPQQRAPLAELLKWTTADEWWIWIVMLCR